MSPGGQQSAAEILGQLKEIIDQQLQVVTYKWLARHCLISASLAKQLLFAFAEAHRGKIAATYFLSGWAKPATDNSGSGSGGGGGDGSGTVGSGGGRRHIAQLVDDARLESRKAELAEVTSLHVYSVQPAQPKDTAELWNTDQVQMEALFARLLKGDTGGSGGGATDSGCVPGVALSAVACEAAVRDPARGPRRAAAAKPPPEPPAAAKPKKPGPAEVLEALQSEVAQRGKTQPQSGNAAAEDAGEAAAPAANGIAKPQGTSRQPAAKAKSGETGSKMAGMWSKAPPKRKAPASAPAAAGVGGDADAALRAAQQDEGASSSSDDDIAVAPRGRARGKRVVADLEDDSDEGEEPAPAAPSPAQAAEPAPHTANGKAGSKAAAKATKAPAAKRGRKSATAAQDGDAADGDAAGADAAEAAAAAQPAAKGNAKGKAAKAAPGHIKLGAETGGAVKRRKVMRTSYDDDGEEVTEMVWEDEMLAAAAPASDKAPMETEGSRGAGEAAAAAGAEGEERPKTRRGSPAKAASSARGSGLSGPTGVQKGDGKASGAGKGSGGAKGSGAGAKKSGKGKAPPPNQRKIMSFFGKPKG